MAYPYASGDRRPLPVAPHESIVSRERLQSLRVIRCLPVTGSAAGSESRRLISLEGRNRGPGWLGRWSSWSYGDLGAAGNRLRRGRRDWQVGSAAG